MKRSQINTILVDAEDYLDVCGITLPSFAYWDPATFHTKVKGADYSEIVARGLGWTVTDFGLGDFTKEGIVVFTTRMGDYRQLSSGSGKLYAEKHIIQRTEQRTPFHRHVTKTEDVVNRGKGTFIMRLFHALDNGNLDEERAIQLQVDGQSRELAPGEAIALRPGEGLTIEPGIYHEFTASGKDTVASEISLANDDANDNFFYDPVAVGQDIEEDEPPRRLLVQDYVMRYKHLLDKT